MNAYRQTLGTGRSRTHRSGQYASRLGAKLGLFFLIHDRSGPDHRPVYLDVRQVIRVVGDARGNQL